MIGSLTQRGRIYLYQKACDMRRSFDRLAGMVVEELGEDPLRGDVFVFINRRGTMLKGLYWDQDGYAIWHKRLERGRFKMPRTKDGTIDRIGWMHMLEGVEVKEIRRDRRYVLGDTKRGRIFSK